MSTALGMAATAAVLQQIIQNGFGAIKLDDLLGVHTINVTCIAPERIAADSEVDQLNLFLYNQMRNPGWFNQDLPSRDARGDRISNPALALDLHFLLGAYGVADFHAEAMLGVAMQTLHDTPGLGRDAIRAALKPDASKPNIPNTFQLAGLADQIEQLRIVALNLTDDELSRIWAALQTPARPSAAYVVSVLLTQTPRSSRTPLPVRTRNLYVVPLNAPRIDQVMAGDSLSEPILPDSVLNVSGTQLDAATLSVLVNGDDYASAVTQADRDHLSFGLSLPAPTPGVPSTLRAGVCTLQIVHPMLMGTPPQVQGGQESNLAAFVLNPAASFVVQAGVTSNVVEGVTYRSGVITASAVPRIGNRQRVRLLLNQINPPAGHAPKAYSFNASAGNGIVAPADSAASVNIEFQQVEQGSYLARLQVDAGTSPLTLGPDGQFAGPVVTP